MHDWLLFHVKPPINHGKSGRHRQGQCKNLNCSGTPSRQPSAVDPKIACALKLTLRQRELSRVPGQWLLPRVPLEAIWLHSGAP